MKFLFLFISYIIIAIGQIFMIKVSFIGLEPWTAAHLGLSNFSLTIGMWTLIIQFIFIFLTYLMDRKKPGIGTFLNMIFIGPLIDFFLYLDFIEKPDNILLCYLFFLLGTFISSIGVTIGILTNIGPGAKTNFYLVFSKKFGKSITLSKTFVELLGIIIALIFKGPIFIGTLIFAIISGPIIQFLIKFFSLFIKEKKNESNS